MSILLGIALLTMFLAAVAFVMNNTLLYAIGLFLTILLVFMALCFEGHVLSRIQRLEKELEKLKRGY